MNKHDLNPTSHGEGSHGTNGCDGCGGRGTVPLPVRDRVPVMVDGAVLVVEVRRARRVPCASCSLPSGTTQGPT